MPRVVPSQVITLIEQFFPFIITEADRNRGIQGGALPQLAAVLELIDQLPQELITLGPDQYVTFVKSVAAIRAIIALWQGGKTTFPLYPFTDGAPLALLRDALLLCPDEFPAASTAELNFIPDDNFRESLRVDISAANRALANAEWKAATVLAGSVVETLLLWALQQRPSTAIRTAVTSLVTAKTLNKDPGTHLEASTWDLHSYIEVAFKLDIIKSSTRDQARLAKDFRNLIHPGRTVRLGQVCNRGTAFSALAAVEHVVEDLTPKVP